LCFQLLHRTDSIFFFFFYEEFNSCQHIILIHDRHIGYFWFKTYFNMSPKYKTPTFLIHAFTDYKVLMETLAGGDIYL